MVHGLAKQQSQRLLKHVVRCYLRLSDNSRAREALRQCLPEPLKHQTFANCLKVSSPTTVCPCPRPADSVRHKRGVCFYEAAVHGPKT